MIRLAPGCFGKLPLHGDFIKHKAEEPELTQLDRWIQEGIVLCQRQFGDQWTQVFASGQPLRFVRFDGRNRFAIGVIRPGRDRVGRLFPFMVYTVSNEKAIRKQPELVPILLEPLFQHAETLVTSHWDGLDLHGLRAYVDGMGVAVDPRGANQRLEAFLGQAPGQLWDQILNGAPDERRYLLLMNVRDLLDQGSRANFPIGLPVSPEPESVAFWLRLIVALRSPGGFPVFAVWGAQGDPGEGLPGLRLTLGPPKPEQFLSLMWPHADRQTTCDASREGLEVADMVANATQRFAALADQPASLEQLIKQAPGVKSA